MITGKRKTEFLALLSFWLLILANGTDFINISDGQVVAYGAIVSGYIGVRSYAKARNGERVGVKTPEA